jgi:hypothetical protein
MKARKRAKKPSKTPQQIGKLSKRKGAGFEREIANELKEIYPTAKRGIGQMRSSAEVADVDGVPFWVECKRQQRVNIHAAVRQAKAAVEFQIQRAKINGDLIPFAKPILVVSRNNCEEPLATMFWQDLKLLLEEIEELKKTADRFHKDLIGLRARPKF